MATFGEYHSIPGLVAGADLSAKQYLAVKMASTAGQVIVCAATTDVPLGILQNDPVAGEPAEVAYCGVVKAKFAASVTAGKLATINTTGQIAGTSVISKSCIGKVFEASSATAGELHPVLLSI